MQNTSTTGKTSGVKKMKGRKQSSKRKVVAEDQVNKDELKKKGKDFALRIPVTYNQGAIIAFPAVSKISSGKQFGTSKRADLSPKDFNEYQSGMNEEYKRLVYSLNNGRARNGIGGERSTPSNGYGTQQSGSPYENGYLGVPDAEPGNYKGAMTKSEKALSIHRNRRHEEVHQLEREAWVRSGYYNSATNIYQPTVNSIPSTNNQEYSDGYGSPTQNGPNDYSMGMESGMDNSNQGYRENGMTGSGRSYGYSNGDYGVPSTPNGDSQMPTMNFGSYAQYSRIPQPPQQPSHQFETYSSYPTNPTNPTPSSFSSGGYETSSNNQPQTGNYGQTSSYSSNYQMPQPTQSYSTFPSQSSSQSGNGDYSSYSGDEYRNGGDGKVITNQYGTENTNNANVDYGAYSGYNTNAYMNSGSYQNNGQNRPASFNSWGEMQSGIQSGSEYQTNGNDYRTQYGSSQGGETRTYSNNEYNNENKKSVYSSYSVPPPTSDPNQFTGSQNYGPGGGGGELTNGYGSSQSYGSSSNTPNDYGNYGSSNNYAGSTNNNYGSSTNYGSSDNYMSGTSTNYGAPTNYPNGNTAPIDQNTYSSYGSSDNYGSTSEQNPSESYGQTYPPTENSYNTYSGLGDNSASVTGGFSSYGSETDGSVSSSLKGYPNDGDSGNSYSSYSNYQPAPNTFNSYSGTNEQNGQNGWDGSAYPNEISVDIDVDFGKRGNIDGSDNGIYSPETYSSYGSGNNGHGGSDTIGGYHGGYDRVGYGSSKAKNPAISGTMKDSKADQTIATTTTTQSDAILDGYKKKLTVAHAA
ncbi:unnamed protein product, partial [Mesorhabditis belari]|uniref:Uncharacterized protein n=1 Tax=Mesorhabditis belari TaxID=2138241 RepID=A0AAF3E9I8_9BILA